MTFDIGLHEVCVRVSIRYVITKFSRMDSLPNFVTHGAPLRARELRYKNLKRKHYYYYYCKANNIIDSSHLFFGNIRELGIFILFQKCFYLFIQTKLICRQFANFLLYQFNVKAPESPKI